MTVSATKPSADHLMGTLLPVLIKDLGVTLTDSPITDRAQRTEAGHRRPVPAHPGARGTGA